MVYLIFSDFLMTVIPVMVSTAMVTIAVVAVFFAEHINML